MASSDDDRDKDSHTSPSKPENPFIKFRQFADSQVSSLLQGVLGLPSAFTKPNSSPRWDILDEDLRRRDESIAKQQALKDAEARRQNAPAEVAHSKEEEVQIPVKTSPDWPRPSSATWSQSSSCKRLGDGCIDLPLYSPVNKSLFPNLHQTPIDGDVNWKDSISSTHVPYYLEPGQVSEDVMGMVRSMIYNNLGQSTRLHSQGSLLPYLLFSPYSPLKLQCDQMKTAGSRTYINYNRAFADLLTTTYEKPGGYSQFKSKVVPGITSFPLMSAALNMQQIDWFFGNGLLEDPASIATPVNYAESATKGASTEQEMYDTFLRLASLPTAATHTFESLFKEVETAVEKVLDPTDAAVLREQREAFEKEHGTSLRELEGMLKSLMNPFREESNRAKTTGPTQDSDRVVATRTITEHSTDEDGTVETSVTVEKTFADGRVTTTHTSHIEDRCEQEPVEEREHEEKDGDEVKKAVKKGWFWN